MRHPVSISKFRYLIIEQAEKKRKRKYRKREITIHGFQEQNNSIEKMSGILYLCTDFRHLTGSFFFLFPLINVKRS